MECNAEMGQRLCKENRIDATMNSNRVWLIPKDAKKTLDGRLKTNRPQNGADENE